MSSICVVTCLKPNPVVGLKCFAWEYGWSGPVGTDIQDRKGPQLYGMRTVSPTSLSQYYRIFMREHTHICTTTYRPKCTYLKIHTYMNSYLHLFKDAVSLTTQKPSNPLLYNWLSMGKVPKLYIINWIPSEKCHIFPGFYSYKAELIFVSAMHTRHVMIPFG